MSENTEFDDDGIEDEDFIWDEDLFMLNSDGEDFEEDADDSYGFQNPVFGDDFTDSDTIKANATELEIDKILDEMGL